MSGIIKALVRGFIKHDDADTDDYPIATGGQARQTNPTAVADADRVRAVFDDIGRQITRPYQVRDLITTASVSLSNGTKTELLAGSTGFFFDLMQISLANNSDAATTVEIYDESTLIASLPIAASKAENFVFTPPRKQSATGVAWYVDLPDITGTTITIRADFSKEV